MTKWCISSRQSIVTGLNDDMGYTKTNKPAKQHTQTLSERNKQLLNIIYIYFVECLMFLLLKVFATVMSLTTQVAPALLEDIIVKHPGVADVAVIGVPDETAGERPKACVVKQPGSHITENDIIQYVHGK